MVGAKTNKRSNEAGSYEVPAERVSRAWGKERLSLQESRATQTPAGILLQMGSDTPVTVRSWGSLVDPVLRMGPWVDTRGERQSSEKQTAPWLNIRFNPTRMLTGN